MAVIIGFIVLGVFWKLIGFTKTAYVFWALSVLLIGDAIINIKKYGSYKGWREAEKLEAEEYAKKKKEKEEKKIAEKAKSEAESFKAETPIIPEISCDPYMLEKYKKRQNEVLKFPELFYPDIGNHRLPTGYQDLPVPSYVVYDLETTGLTPTHDEILEIGAIRIVNGDITGVFHEYVCPSSSIPSNITKINGITNEMVEGCRNINEVLPDFIAFTERLPMVAYNSEFDYSFLKEAQLKINGKKFIRKHYCAMKTYKKYYIYDNDCKPYGAKLSDAVINVLGHDYYNEFIKTNHKALVDASATQFIFETIGGIWNMD